MSETEQNGVDQTLSESEAEDLLREATAKIDEVRNNYPPLTDELEALLAVSRSSLSAVYFRVGREQESPSLREIVGRNTRQRDTD